MTQIKDSAGSNPNEPSKTLRPEGPGAIDGQISGLLSRRQRLVEDLAEVDRQLAELRSAREDAAPGVKEAPRWFPILGEQLIDGRFAVPAGLDRDDLNRRLGIILVDERRHGRPVDGLELLVSFLGESGRVLAVRTRRSGEVEWVRRFEAMGRCGGH